MSVVGEERERRGEDRRMIFSNFLNGVRPEQMAETFARSVEGVEQDILFVGKKLREARHMACLHPEWGFGMPVPVACETLEDILDNRAVLISSLEQIGNASLGTDLILPRLQTQFTNGKDVKDVMAMSSLMKARFHDETPKIKGYNA